MIFMVKNALPELPVGGKGPSDSGPSHMRPSVVVALRLSTFPHGNFCSFLFGRTLVPIV